MRYSDLIRWMQVSRRGRLWGRHAARGAEGGPCVGQGCGMSLLQSAVSPASHHHHPRPPTPTPAGFSASWLMHLKLLPGCPAAARLCVACLAAFSACLLPALLDAAQDPVPLDKFDDWIQCSVPGIKADLTGKPRRC